MTCLIEALKFPEPIAQALFKRKGAQTVPRAIAKYKADLSRKFDALAPFLASIEFTSVFDIGCGLAGMDALIAARFDVKEFHLLDGDGTGEQLTGYSKFAPKPWDDVALGALFLSANAEGVAVHTHQPHSTFAFTADLVISLRSWGLHYPVTTYLGVVQRCLKPGGHVVTDIRNGTYGTDVLQRNGFKFVWEIPETSAKCKRLAFQWRD